MVILIHKFDNYYTVLQFIFVRTFTLCLSIYNSVQPVWQLDMLIKIFFFRYTLNNAQIRFRTYFHCVKVFIILHQYDVNFAEKSVFCR